MKLTFYGHACFSVQTAGKTILFDPFISGNELAKNINIDGIHADYILLSHAHGDHIADVERIAKNSPNCQIVSSYEVVAYFQNKGLNGHPMNLGGKWNFDFGTVHYVNAVHSSAFPDGSYGGNPGGFVVTSTDGTFYYSGDTALTWDMKLIPMLFPKLNFAVLCMGDNFTMGWEHALIASDFIECGNIVGCHFDTFGFIRIDHAAAQKAFAEKDKVLLLPEIGKSYDM